MNEEQKTMTEEEWEEAYEQSHMDRWQALEDIKNSVYNEHQDEFMRASEDELEDLIRRVSEQMVEVSGGILMPDEADSFIRTKLAETEKHSTPSPTKDEPYDNPEEEYMDVPILDRLSEA